MTSDAVVLREPPAAVSACRFAPGTGSCGRRKHSTGRLLSIASLCSFFVALGSAAAPAGLFREAADETGLRFRHFTGANGKFYLPEIMGPGAALLDYDRDGDLDAYLLQGTMLDRSVKPAGSLFPPAEGFRPGNRLFRNELIPGGKLRFTDVTDGAGVGHEGYGMGAAVGDYDNDGDPDLYVTYFGPNVLYRNNGDGTFTDVTAEAGVDDDRWSTSATFLDYDRDGDLDLFFVNYLDFTLAGNRRCFSPAGELDYCTPAVYRPVPDRLFRNEGQGRFTDVTLGSGTGAKFGPGLGVVASDVDLDGWLDIYVANDGAANLLWMNRRNGTFEELGLESGAAYAADGVPRAGMGVAAGDFDNDGDDDIVVTNLRREGCTLFRNEEPGFFNDASEELGLSPSFLFTGFGVHWFDYDNDGRLELFVANGAVTILETLRGSPYPFHQRNQLFHNEGEGRGFVETGPLAGPALALSEVSRGAAFGDIDNDGDIDILVSNNNGPTRLLLNQAGGRNSWLLVRLQGTRDNRDGLGARLALRRKGLKTLWRHASSDGSYLSAGDSRVHFGLGHGTAIESLEVHWPCGGKEVWTDIRPNTFTTLRQGTGNTP